MKVFDLGKAAYKPTLQLQHRLVEEMKAAESDKAYLLLVEHDPPVITMGRRGRMENVLATAQQLAAEGIEIHTSTRGGDVTYHGPGQLVGYPILRLDRRGYDVGRYVRDLEETLIRLLAPFGVVGRRIGGLTGVWVGDEKLAAIGIAVSRWVTFHGFALNVSTNLAHFDFIVPCGIAGRRVTSLSRLLGRPVSVEEVKPLLIECVADVFGFRSVEAHEFSGGLPIQQTGSGKAFVHVHQTR